MANQYSIDLLIDVDKYKKKNYAETSRDLLFIIIRLYISIVNVKSFNMN